jgi:hypothetical protein
MPEYARCKLYQITSPHSKLTYVGSTCYQYLCQRWRMHAYSHRTDLSCSARRVLDCGDATIQLLEAVPCATRDEVATHEQRWMDKLRADGVPLVNERRARSLRRTSGAGA